MISVMFHSAGLRDLAWRSSHISEPLDIMREKLSIINKEGYSTVFMAEAAENSGHERDGLIHLTFDDGYLDNWVHVFPMLREFGLKATIFVTADFVDCAEVVREQKEIFERKHDPSGCCAGFLSFSEMRKMEESGLVEIQSHSLTHTWYFKGPAIVDFWHPGAATEHLGPIWMLWNLMPDRKPYYLSEAQRLEARIPYGTPIYEHGKSLETLRFFPDEDELEESLVSLAREKGKEFFKNAGWRKELYEIVGKYREKRGSRGAFETKEEYGERIRTELLNSKKKLEDGLGHEVDGLCWPGGGVTEEAVKMARNSGYKYLTRPGKFKRSNHQYLEDGMIDRIGSLPRLRVKGRDLGYPSGADFKYYLRYNNGYYMARWLYDIKRLKRILAPYSG